MAGDAGLVSIALGLASVSVAGLYSNHAELSRKHASILLGLTNTTAAIPGIIGVTITGVIYDRTNNWYAHASTKLQSSRGEVQ